ncbi:hypothetical protein ACIS_00701 [Anaplasma centrale str. Israel]|uniref:Uncharacterized protein n=1 Tax=Anaplasma centrale (strain Israel) TaxID=574556 RepID=D1AUP3_ANACI|nr:hypothetical protein [Anaplasma centrale]ACZ49271.1 hypothetical protein ACIS_00701 [Anaplasma centrale str. Israel]
MNLLDKGGIPRSTLPIRELLITAVATAVTISIMKAHNDKKRALCVFISFVATACLMQQKKKFFRDSIQIFFSEDAKKGIVTFAEAPITKISITATNERCSDTPYTMVAELKRPTISIQGKKSRAIRKISLQSYGHSWDHTANSDAPQMTVFISGRNKKHSIEADFTCLRGRNSLLLDIKSKRYEEYIPLCRVRNTRDYIRKALEMKLKKKSFLQTLLARYLSKDTFPANKEKAMYLIHNFGDMLHKSSILAMSKALERLVQIDYETTKSKLELSDKSSSTTRYPSGRLSHLKDGQLKSLEADILMLVKARACEYENLHEALGHNVYKSAMNLGIEDVIACYPDRVNQATNTLIKTYIASHRTLAPQMKAIHKYIETCRKHHNKQLQRTTDCTKTVDSHAHQILCSFAKQEGISPGDLCAIIEHARNKLCRKYRETFVDDITGITQKVTARISKIRIKIGKFESQDMEMEDHELCDEADEVDELHHEAIEAPLSDHIKYPLRGCR